MTERMSDDEIERLDTMREHLPDRTVRLLDEVKRLRAAELPGVTPEDRRRAFALIKEFGDYGESFQVDENGGTDRQKVELWISVGALAEALAEVRRGGR